MKSKTLWRGTVLFILLYFRGCASQNVMSPTEGGDNSTQSVMLGTTPAVTGDDVKVVVFTEESGITPQTGTERQSPKSSTAAVSSSSVSSTSTLLTSPRNTLTSPRNTPEQWKEEWDLPFDYDYTFLRTLGLSIAAVLFLFGIMVILCGKMRWIPRCRSKRRSYQMTRM
ncbi:FXYD domain-containing ion transport regulator 5 [Electrophorus electricus]|uniref:FXYD domain-containing ion transport regulator 5 n=1 Tax=Electrophorus electricus TaxID=8005 RepID=UPI0015D00A00|nr:FXYD domain-containing ion transport regulator 5 [Electrophorus electricus]